MADNTTLPSATGGDVVRTDDVGGVKVPVAKLATGPAGRDDGVVTNANPLPVSDLQSRRLLEKILTAVLDGNETLERLLSRAG